MTHLKKFQDRPYQVRIWDRLRNGWRRLVKSQLIVSPTGSGKTVMGLRGAKDIIELAMELFGVKPEEVGIGWVAHRAKLLKQAKDENLMIGCPNVHYISMFDTD